MSTAEKLMPLASRPDVLEFSDRRPLIGRPNEAESKLDLFSAYIIRRHRGELAPNTLDDLESLRAEILELMTGGGK